MLNIKIRPITQWPGKETANPKNTPFKAKYSDTKLLLEYELDKLDYVPDSVVLEMFVDPGKIRQDGQLRANVRPYKDGVILRFTRKTNRHFDRNRGQYVYTPKQVAYPCDAFTASYYGQEGWQENLRAIALSLEALRKVERYGVFSYEQIIDRLSLPEANESIKTQAAAEFLSRHSGVDAVRIINEQTVRAAAYKKAALKLHPDHNGGDATLFHELREHWSALQ